MQKRNKLIVGFTSIVLSGTLAFGAIASAAGEGDGGGGDRHHHTTQEKCDRVDDIQGHVAQIQGRIVERIATLKGRRAAAEASGDTARVEHIDRRLARLDKISTRLSARLTKVETWAAAHCAG